MKLSVVINNYNYGRYLKQCIQSVLDQTQPFDEVIVVDDGSTDDSRELIAEFKDRITPILQPNGGQAAALNAGYNASSGDLVLFLDADDFLELTACAHILSAWRDNFAKLQYRLKVVDNDSVHIGELPMPSLPLPTGNALGTLITDGRYGSMPTSANVYRRTALEHIMPIPAEEFRISADLFINIKIVRHGELGAIEDTLGAYRVHGKNQFKTGSLITLDTQQLTNRVRSHFQRSQLVAEEAKRSGRDTPPSIYFSIPGWIDRIIAFRLNLQTPAGETATRTELKHDFHTSLEHKQRTSSLLKACAEITGSLLLYCPVWFIKLLGWLESVTPQAIKRIPYRLLGVAF
ncbi:glycosyltransferase family 2 protein [Cerasicoccus maritimus]|uniref:glycosyltransferase family 2 protein n=1 Tax=Cerasicoccus maritimus TaxID=490089 RepID=UPI002852BDF6|nr:glycosyltransferase [Cerasicoccus maritimus]